MAGNGDIRTKIVLDGEQEYSKAIKDAQRNLRVLRSELKAETAEMGKNASEQDKNAAKVKNLRQQIEEQEKVVRAYEAALKEVRENYADNEEAIARWEIKLNDARTALATMRNGLEDTGKAFDSVSASADNGVSATHDFAESLGKIADVGESVSGKIEGFFSGMVSTIQSAIGELWGQLMEVAAKANNWTDLAAMFGTDASTIQKWSRASGANLKDFSSLTGMAQKVLTGDAHKIAEATNVDITGYTDQWEAFTKVMEKLSGMSQPEQLKALSHMGINGPKEAGWLDMLNAWDGIVKDLDKYDAENGGLGISAEDIENLNALSLQAASLQKSWKAFKESWVAGLAPLAMNITGNLEDIVVALNKYFKAETPEERQVAIDEIKKNIEEIFAAVREAFEQGIGLLSELAANLKESEDPSARALGEFLDNLVGTLQWFANEKNWQTVASGFEALIGVWVGAKVATAVGNIGSFAFNAMNLAKYGSPTPTVVPTGSGGNGGTHVVATGGSIIKALIPNALAAWGAWEGFKGLPADSMTRIKNMFGMDTSYDQLFDKINKATGKNSMGDIADELMTPEGNERAKKAWQSLLFGDKGKKSEEPPAEIEALTEEAAAEIVTGKVGEILNPKGRTFGSEKELPAETEALAEEAATEIVNGKIEDLYTNIEKNTFDPEKARELLREQQEPTAEVTSAEKNTGLKLFDDMEKVQRWVKKWQEPEETAADEARKEAEASIQDWWDRWREQQMHPSNMNKMNEKSAVEWMNELLGDDAETVRNQILEMLRESELGTGMEDVPEGWYNDMLNSMDLSEQTNSELKKSADGLKDLDYEGAVARGFARAAGGIRVDIDGETAGRILSPYVSANIASFMAV